MSNQKPILNVCLRVELPLDGLAERIYLDRLSEKTVTAKVRNALRQMLGKKDVSVGCKALQTKGGWLGYGYYRGEEFHWFVTNSKPLWL